MFLGFAAEGEELTAALRACRARLDPRGLRLVPEHQCHATVVFLGDTPVEGVPGLVESVQRCCQSIEPMLLRFGRLTGFPKPQSARSIVLAADASPAFLDLVDRLGTELGQKSPSRQRPIPHITLARSRVGVTVAAMTVVANLACTTLVLWQSELSPQGAHHQRIQEFPLGRGHDRMHEMV